MVVEFLSPRTEPEDLGQFYGEGDRVSDELPGPAGTRTTPSKLEVYEQYLRVPHYVVSSRYTQILRYFKLGG